YDDLNERAGVKFNDPDLIGIPVRVVFGKIASEGFVEVTRRDTGYSEEVYVNDLVTHLEKLYEQF
ncbi:proline--tRNA ligase, partial [Staphylococcus pseudintermedius]|uniref:His/Gly/Thr/Pro-type tRNA ligase C-terminal domain-containing protein n=1 Tax=Staphylococcus pseudintermedius TaxID=283734 RepID=UPI000E37D97C